ncbi:MAG TPA: hypothetical protein PLJ35_05355 [Anaerolineae bacterium]|nr:hypothetical protein [Anaerolineae bacterium]
MAFWRNEQTYTQIEHSVFDKIERTKALVMTSAARNPITTGAREKYRIHAGTPIGPIGNGFVSPIIRSRIVATAPSGSTSVYVDDVTGFKAGDVLLYFSTLTGTAAFATVSTVTDASNLITLTDAITASAGDYIEVAANGAHGNTTAANPTQTPDVFILLEDVDVLAPDGATLIPVPCVGVDAGVIRVGNLTGQCCATFDNINLRAQLPDIRFDNTTVGR